MRRLDRIISMSVVGALGLLVAPVTMAQGPGFGFGQEGFVGATIDCSQWEEGSFQRNICERIQERVAKHQEKQEELEDACGEREDTDEYRECARELHEEKRAEMKEKREEIREACGDLEKGSDEHRECVIENGGEELKHHRGRGHRGFGHSRGRSRHFGGFLNR